MIDFPPFTASPPKNGAWRMSPGATLDVRFLAELAQNVHSAAREQEAAGEQVDEVFFHEIEGQFDWRAYVRHEFRIARDRSAEVAEGWP